MDGPRHPPIFSETSLTNFLASVVKKKRLNPNWTFGLWARQLGIDNVSTLTRIVHGERVPGPEFIRALADHFRFDALETEYLDALVLGAKSSDNSMLGNMVERKLSSLCAEHVRRMSPPSDAANVLSLSQGELLGLWGKASIDRVNTWLADDNLCAVPMDGHALVGLSAARYGVSSFGGYDEFYVAILAKKPNLPNERAGLFFKFLVGSSVMASTYWEIIWGLRYQPGKIVFDSEARPAGAGAWQGDTLLAQLKPQAPEQSVVEQRQLELFGIAKTAERASIYRIIIESRLRTWPFNAEREALLLPENSPVARLVQALAFSPTYWEHHSDLACAVGSPEEL